MKDSALRRLAACLLAVGGLALASFLVVVHAVPLQVLFVTGSTSLGPGDQAIKTRLEANGYTVEVRAASAPNLADTTGKDLVLISSSASATTVGATFKTAAIGVVTWQSSLFDDMALTGTVVNTDYGTANHFTEILLSSTAPTEPDPPEEKDPGSLTASLPDSNDNLPLSSHIYASGPWPRRAVPCAGFSRDLCYRVGPV